MCNGPFPFYFPHGEEGIKVANSWADGYTIAVGWTRAYPNPTNLQLGYNIYYSTEKNEIFSEGPKYLSIVDTLNLELFDFTPGDTFYFAVRATQFDSILMNVNSLPDSGDSKIYPQGALLSDVGLTDASIFISDLNNFPNFGIVQIGIEIINYTNKDLGNNSITGLTRALYGTEERIHQTDGYDGYYFWDPAVKIWKGLEEQNLKIFQETSYFAYPNWAFTEADGYKFTIDQINNLNELKEADDNNVDLPKYDNSGYRRTDIAALLKGECSNSYILGERGCADGYDGSGRQVRGDSVNDQSAERIELQLELTGKPMVLLRRLKSGIRCLCYEASKEYADPMCPVCFGVGFVMGYEQFHNVPRRSDGRILVKFDPTDETVPYFQDLGLENTYSPNAYTILYPTLANRDVLVNYTDNGDQEEFRYEITSLTRNYLFFGQSSAQKFRMTRIRKTDPVYKVPVFANSATLPQQIISSIYSGPGILPHSHTIYINENIFNIAQINQQTSVGGGNDKQMHSHSIINGEFITNLKSGIKSANGSTTIPWHVHNIII